MSTNEQPAHAPLSASGAARWMNCWGSVEAEKPFPNTSSVFAEEGTAAHELAERCLNTGDSPAKYINEAINDITVSEEMAEYVQAYIDIVRSYDE